jgi:flagellar biosynthetic protein FliR
MPILAELTALAPAFLLMFARVGAILMVLPVFSEDAIPGQVRILFAVGMSFALWGIIGPHLQALPTGQTQVFGTLVIELGLGLAIGTLIKIMFQAVVMGASIISLQVGLSSALVFDPALGGQSPVLAKLVAVAAALFCMSLGLHHYWVATIVRSYDVFPVGVAPDVGDFASLAVSTLSKATTLAVSLAGPFIVYGIVFNVALGFSARLAPSIQVFFIAQPLNIVMGLALFATTLGAILAEFASVFTSWMQSGWS